MTQSRPQNFGGGNSRAPMASRPQNFGSIAGRGQSNPFSGPRMGGSQSFAGAQGAMRSPISNRPGFSGGQSFGSPRTFGNSANRNFSGNSLAGRSFAGANSGQRNFLSSNFGNGGRSAARPNFNGNFGGSVAGRGVGGSGLANQSRVAGRSNGSPFVNNHFAGHSGGIGSRGGSWQNSNNNFAHGGNFVHNGSFGTGRNFGGNVNRNFNNNFNSNFNRNVSFNSNHWNGGWNRWGNRSYFFGNNSPYRGYWGGYWPYSRGYGYYGGFFPGFGYGLGWGLGYGLYAGLGYGYGGYGYGGYGWPSYGYGYAWSPGYGYGYGYDAYGYGGYGSYGYPYASYSYPAYNNYYSSYSAVPSYGYGLSGYSSPTYDYSVYSSTAVPDYSAYDAAPAVAAEAPAPTPTVDSTVVSRPTSETALAADTPANVDEITAADFAGQGELNFKAGKYQAAARDFRHALVDDPTNAGVLMLLGQTAFAMGQYNEAAGAIELAMKLLPEDKWGSIITDYTQLYGNPEDYTTQLRALEKARNEKRDDPAIRFLLGYDYYYLGHIKEALAELDKAIQLEPKDPFARKLRNLAATKLGLPTIEAPTTKAQPDGPAIPVPAVPVGTPS
jgi:tetratricopeptide (TPR) repeat protein